MYQSISPIPYSLNPSLRVSFVLLNLYRNLIYHKLILHTGSLYSRVNLDVQLYPHHPGISITSNALGFGDEYYAWAMAECVMILSILTALFYKLVVVTISKIGLFTVKSKKKIV